MVFKTLTSFPKGQKCQLCLTTKVDPEALGNICQTADVIVHYFCLLLASKIQQKGTDKQGLLGFFSRDIKKEIKRGSTIVCNYCKKNGATVVCSRENCHLNFHVPCAQQKGSLHQYFNEFKSFCDKHKPRQKIPATLKKKKDLDCVLCCSPIKFNARSHEDDPIWPICCKPKALLHKRCLQHFATSSGYYFKCPYCSNKDEFHQGMKTYGIYIPEQEASWETEPNAYRELLERDVNCNAGRCRCPRGRVYSVRNSKWYLEVCILCGANGRHRGCMLENIMTDTYECDVCAKVNPNYLNSVSSEDIAESSPLSDQGGCNETVQASIEGNISKNLPMGCGEIIEISDSESDMQHGVDIPPPVTKNARKRRLSVRQEKQSGLKRQRLAEGGAETTPEMCFTIDEESGSSMPRVMDNPSLRTDKLANNPQTSEINLPNRESTDVTGDDLNLCVQKICTITQKEVDEFCSNCRDITVVQINQKQQIDCVDLVSDNETDEVFVISDTDTESNASSLLDSDSSLLDLSEIPESEKSLLFDNFSQPNNYAKEFPRRPQTKRKRRKKKKCATPQTKKPSVKIIQNVLKSNTLSNEDVNTCSDQRNLESSSSLEVRDTNIPLNSHVVNCDSSEEESFRGFSTEESQSNNKILKISAPILPEGSIQANKSCSNGEKIINSTQQMSGKQIFLSSVDDINKCFTLDNLNLINSSKNRTCQVNDMSQNTQPKLTDDNTIKTIKNSVLKYFEKDDTNYNKSVSNNCELSICNSNTNSNATVTSPQELPSDKSGIDAVICNADPSELSRNTTNTNEGKFDSDKLEMAEALHEVVDDETNVNSVVIKECITEKKLKKTKPVTKKTSKSGYISKTKRANKNNKPKIICSLELNQSFSEIIHSLSKINGEKHHKNRSHDVISSKKDVLPSCDDELKINHRHQFFSPKTSSNEVGSRILYIPDEIPNGTEDSVSPENSGLQLELHLPEICKEACSSGADQKLESSIHSAHHLPMRCNETPENVSDSTVPKSGGICNNQPLAQANITEDPFNLPSSKYLDLVSSVVNSQPQIVPSSKIASEVPLKSKSSENISEIAPVASTSFSYRAQIDSQSPVSNCEYSIKSDSSEVTHNADLEPRVFVEHSESLQNTVLEEHSVVSTTSTMVESRNSELSYLLEDKAYIKPSDFKENKNSSFQSPVNSPCQELESSKLKPTKSEVLENSSKLTPNIKTYKSPKTRDHKIKPEHGSRKRNSSQTKSSKTSNDKNMKEFSHVGKEKKQTKPKPEAEVEPSKVSLPQVYKVTSSDPDLSQETSKVHSNVDTIYPSDDSRVYPPLNEKNSECNKKLVQTNKPEIIKTLIAPEENKLPIEIRSNLKDIGDSITNNGEVISLKIQDKNMINEIDENKVNCASNEFEKQMSCEDSKAHLNPVNSKDLHPQNPLKTYCMTEENKLPVNIENNLKNTDDSTTIKSETTNKQMNNEMIENKVNCASRDSEAMKHDWYKMCNTECSTCYNSVTLTTKQNIVENDKIDVCFYCKDKINSTSIDTLSQVPSTCSCQENKNDSEIFNDSKLSKDNSSIGSDLNSNYKTNKSLEKQKSSFKDGLSIDCKELNTARAKSSLNLPHERKNMVTESEGNSSMQDTPSSLENSFVISEKICSKTPKIKRLANINNKSTQVLDLGTPRQIFNEVNRNDYKKRSHELRRYYDNVINVRIILNKVNKANKPSLMSHVETFWVDYRQNFRELLKARYFSENDKKLLVYTDVCGFRYVRLFIENIPEKVEPRVVFETGGDIPFYLQKLINYQETEKAVSPLMVLIVYGNTLIPEENVFNLLELASNLNRIKLVVTTVPSQKPGIMKFNRKLMYLSKQFGYYVWDITRINFLTDNFER